MKIACRYRCIARLLIAATVATATNVAHAVTPSESAAAQALFDKARQLMAAGKYAQACPKLEESQRLDPSTGTLLNLAACYEHQGRLASAWTKFIEAESSARSAGSTERAAAARERAAALAPRLAKLVIVVGGHPDDLQVRRDGELVGSAQWGIPIPVDSGEHLIAVAAVGKKPWQTKVSVQGDGTTATVSVPELESPQVAGPAPASLGESATATGASARTGGTKGMRLASYAALGVGAIGLGVGTVFGLRSMRQRGQADEVCPDPNRCPVAQRDLVDGLDENARSAKTVATVALLGGGVATGVGVALLLMASSKPSSAESQRPHLEPWIGLTSIGVAGRF